MLAMAQTAPTFTKDQKQQIVKYINLSNEIAMLPKVQERDKLQPEVQKVVADVCKAPAWVFNLNVPNAEGTGTEPGCLPAPKKEKP
jgi:hypothetical protein